MLHVGAGILCWFNHGIRTISFGERNIPTGQSVFFQIEGDLETDFVTLYDVLRGPQIDDGSIRLLLDEKSTWYPSNHPQIRDLGFAHDVCSGIGGFHTAFSFLGGNTISSVDFSPFGLLCVSPCVWTWSMC